jgi:hypothetical protein
VPFWVYLQHQSTERRAITSEEGPKLDRSLCASLFARPPYILSVQKNIDSWCTRKGDLQRAFPPDDPMAHSSALTISIDGERLTCGGFSLDEPILQKH